MIEVMFRPDDGRAFRTQMCADREDARRFCHMLLRSEGTTHPPMLWIAVNDGAIRLAEWRAGEGWYKGAAPQQAPGFRRPEKTTPPPPVRPPYEDLPPSMATVEQVCTSDLSAWSMSRLSLWTNRAPLVLIAALKEGADLSAYPRSKGPHSRADLDAVECYAVTIQCAAALHHWIKVAAWAEAVLYPTWRERTGKAHACEARVQWLLHAAHLTPYLPDVDHTGIDYQPTHH